jgi:predicted cupin superfamily sugar epimerase
MNRGAKRPLSREAQEIIAALELQEHPEGGFYRETFRAPLLLSGLPYVASGAHRHACTAIYFLLPAGSFSAFHRIPSDEIWHHYQGDPVLLHMIDERGEHRTERLGAAVSQTERPQAVVPSGVWQAAVPVGERYALLGCTVAPGFDFADFEMPGRRDLVRRFPEHGAIIEALTSPEG